MDSGSAKGLVIGAAAGAGILASAADLATGNPPDVRVAVGVVLAAAVLYAAADWAPDLAAAFAVLLLTGAVLTNGKTVADVVRGATKK